MNVYTATTALLFLFFTASCGPAPDMPAETASVELSDPNPAADGFNEGASDGRAVTIADSVVNAHGGRRAYDQTRYLKWNFFGVRTLTWDKEDQRVRIEVPDEEMTYLLDYSDGQRLTGAVSRGGEEMTDPDSLSLYLKKANSMFINDSYWLIQPFKLKDSGVTLTYGGQKNDPQKDRPSHILELTFEDVGDTPGNRYRLFVDEESYRFNTWQFFRSADDEEPSIETPFDDYQEYGDILISADRGGRFQLSDISVSQEMEEAEAVFTEF